MMFGDIFTEFSTYLGIRNVSVVVFLLGLALHGRKGLKLGGAAAGWIEILFWCVMFNVLLLASGVQEPRPERSQAILNWILQHASTWLTGLV